MDSLLTKVAKATGKSRWADKTPQNFHHFHLLAQRFPRARFVFLFRNPYSILASYKFASGEGHDSRRYHPLVYSLYWRSAARLFLSIKEHAAVQMVRYEDILERPAAVCSALGGFLGSRLEVSDLSSLGHNSSFDGQTRKSINKTERWICAKVCGAEMDILGYKPDNASHPELADVSELLVTSARFARYQLARLARDRDARRRTFAFLGGLAKR